MIEEYKNIRQIENDVFRRYFSDQYFELYIFYKLNKEDITGFQLIYKKGKSQRVYTWMQDQGFKHSKIDDGDDKTGRNRSPILVDDGLFDKKNILKKFIKSSQNIEKKLVDFIVEKILEYERDKENIFL